MSCKENKKSFLGIRYFGDHDYVIVHIGVFIRYDDLFVVEYICSQCGCPHKRHFVEYDELFNLGFTHDTLEEAKSAMFGIAVSVDPKIKPGE